ncbi:helix-turn-helix transcriptional regulator [Mycobacterium deserti]|uniref:AAA family ATPase n=1 Tax=Mycobacterium deserti TaxID=2978347 RepID=A0ABT2ML86_9MYCO|nr:LuxR family transcriptional regulator [Mycobacterium deserti]MCT7661830.1 AAA family ATPase [Mycobacterium deserti]
MATHVVGRDSEFQALDGFLASMSAGPSALVVEGAAGIGKTTVWLAGLERAKNLGIRVLSTRTTSAESVLAYSSLADLLGDLDDDDFAALPPPQRIAIDQVLLRGDADGLVCDQRAVAAAFVSVIERLAEISAVLMAIDDLQWLDLPSAHIVSSAVRRLPAPVGVLATVRTETQAAEPRMSLELCEPEKVRHLRVGALSAGALHAVLSERLGRSFSRPKMRQICDVSGGNPFYALELAGAMDDDATDVGTSLPPTLGELVRARIGGLDPQLQTALLAAACVATPTVTLVAAATGCDVEHVRGMLADAESKGIVGIEGHRLRFTHPLLARGVQTGASPTKRRNMHRRLAELVEHPELRARHLALAATSGDPDTVLSLDTAAESARVRGAPATAAELLGLAMGLGGDTPERRIRLARYHFEAGEPAQSRALLVKTIEMLAPGMLRADASNLLAVVHIFEDSLSEASAVLQAAVDQTGDNLALKVQMLVTLSFALLNAGEVTSALCNVEDAVANAEHLGQPQQLSQALGMRTMLHFLAGNGLEGEGLRRALASEEPHSDLPVAFRPSMQNAMLLSWTGHLPQARKAMLSIRRRCIERGEESEWMFVAFNSFLNEIWIGDFREAATVADDAAERAQQMGGDVNLSAALTMRAALATYAGRAGEARADATEALAASQRCGSAILAGWPITILGFLEVSLGNHGAALTTFEPMLSRVKDSPNASEIFVAGFVPDAVEAMIALGRVSEAEEMVDVLERNGHRLDRPWMLATSGRCRAMLFAARGDAEAADVAAQRAMAEHDRLPMPFERARTQLLVGQLQRRQRRREAASATLREALATFECLGTPLWAERAHAELQRASGTRTRAELTASERRVAELAATGITNREMAAALFISPKTVEANLSRIYRKLSIHSRAELGRHMGRPDG